MIRKAIFILLLAFIGYYPTQSVSAQDLQVLKRGVVRIINPSNKSQGTGFIIHISPDRSQLFILTASHVVTGVEFPEIYFFNRSGSVKGKIINREDDEVKGLALIVVSNNVSSFSDLISLDLAESASVQGGEAGYVIGFPSGTSIPTITPASVARREGRNIVFSGGVNPGNSGGPLIVAGKVIGLVTDATSLAYATPTESVIQYISGISLDIAKTLKNFEVKPTSDKAIILVSDFRRKDQKNYGVTETILSQLRGATKDYSDIQIQALGDHISVEQGSDVARAKGKERNASIVIWGGYNTAEEEVVVSVNYEILQRPRGLEQGQESEILRAPVTEFKKNFNVQTRLSNKMAYLTFLTTGLARLEVDDYDGAIVRLTYALAQPDAPERLIDRADVYFNRARAYLMKGLFLIDDIRARNESINLGVSDISKYITLYPNGDEGYVIRAYFHLLLDNQEGAFADSNKAIELDAGSYMAYMIRSQLYIAKGDTERAITSLNKALQLMGEEVDKFILYFNRGMLHMMRDNYDGAISDFSKLLKVEPNSPATAYLLLMRGTANAAKGDYDTAIEDFNQSIRMDPSNALFYYARGHAYSDNANDVGAVDDYSKAMAIMNSKGTTSIKFGNQEISLIEIYKDRAYAYERLGKYDKAISDLEQVLSTSSTPEERKEIEQKIRVLRLKTTQRN